eukprot:1283352-Rhodomonas_salina.1
MPSSISYRLFFSPGPFAPAPSIPPAPPCPPAPGSPPPPRARRFPPRSSPAPPSAPPAAPRILSLASGPPCRERET